jgi:hypothetical protein
LFNGTTDVIKCSLGAAGVGAGPVTYAAVWKIGAVDSSWRGIMSVNQSGGTEALGMERSNGNFLAMTVTQSAQAASSNSIIGTTGWVLTTVTKATGTVAPHVCTYGFTGATWTNQSAGSTLADGPSVSGGNLTFGGVGNAPADFFSGKLAVAGIWNIDMYAAAGSAYTYINALTTNLKTSDWWNSAAGRPVGLWEFNQASTGTSVPDLTGGGANQSAISGTTVSTGDDPPGWTFDGTGGAASGNPQLVSWPQAMWRSAYR